MQKIHVHFVSLVLLLSTSITALKAMDGEGFLKKVVHKTKEGIAETRDFIKDPKTKPKDLALLALIGRRSHDDYQQKTQECLNEITADLNQTWVLRDDCDVLGVSPHANTNPVLTIHKKTQLAVNNLQCHEQLSQKAEQANRCHRSSAFLNNWLLLSAIPLARNSRQAAAGVALAGVGFKIHSTLAPRFSELTIKNAIHQDEKALDDLAHEAILLDDELRDHKKCPKKEGTCPYRDAHRRLEI